jgi:hypothetical protein
LNEKRYFRAQTHYAHITLQDVDELRKLVKTGTRKEAADWRDTLVTTRVCKQLEQATFEDVVRNFSILKRRPFRRTVERIRTTPAFTRWQVTLRTTVNRQQFHDVRIFWQAETTEEEFAGMRLKEKHSCS